MVVVHITPSDGSTTKDIFSTAYIEKIPDEVNMYASAENTIAAEAYIILPPSFPYYRYILNDVAIEYGDPNDIHYMSVITPPTSATKQNKLMFKGNLTQLIPFETEIIVQFSDVALQEIRINGTFLQAPEE